VLRTRPPKTRAFAAAQLALSDNPRARAGSKPFSTTNFRSAWLSSDPFSKRRNTEACRRSWTVLPTVNLGEWK
jgi:hypothetical protein